MVERSNITASRKEHADSGRRHSRSFPLCARNETEGSADFTVTAVYRPDPHQCRVAALVPAGKSEFAVPEMRTAS